jgi:hypothetical protein
VKPTITALQQTSVLRIRDAGGSFIGHLSAPTSEPAVRLTKHDAKKEVSPRLYGSANAIAKLNLSVLA